MYTRAEPKINSVHFYFEAEKSNFRDVHTSKFEIRARSIGQLERWCILLTEEFGFLEGDCIGSLGIGAPVA